ncbi:MAG: integrase core domain-containing protein [Chloroflexota bacterium]|nr:integrase core domain-containing protein [Chloroflexota bacterium]
MPGKAHSPEQIVRKLRQVEVAVAGSKSVGQAVRGVGVTDHTYYRWRQEYNTIRPHSSLGYRPPVPEETMPRLQLVANPR